MAYKIKDYTPWDKRLVVYCGEVNVLVDHDDVDHADSEALAEQIALLPELIREVRAARAYGLGSDKPSLTDALDEIEADRVKKQREQREFDEGEKR